MSQKKFRGNWYNEKIATQDGQVLNGTHGNDWLVALGGANQINSGSGLDVVLAGVTFTGIQGSGELSSLFKGDYLTWVPIATAGNNTITTGNGADYVVSGAGNDIINLGNGNNIYDGRAGGSDRVTAGYGDDILVFDSLVMPTTSITTVDGGGGNNILKLMNQQEAYVTVGQGNNKITVDAADIANITTGNGNNRITMTELDPSGVGLDVGSFFSTIRTGSGNDVIKATSAANFGHSIDLDAGSGRNVIDLFTSIATVKTGNDDDVINASATSITVNSGGGNDRISVGGVSSIDVNAGEGNNRVSIGGFGNTAQLTVGSGNNIIKAIGLGTQITTGNGNNQINLTEIQSFANVTLGSGNDVVYSGYKENDINLGGGNNWLQLVGEAPFSSTFIPLKITAGGGKDVFSLGDLFCSVDIMGYGKNDKILLNNLTGVSVTQVAQDVQIQKAGNTNVITVKNTTTNNINLASGSAQPISAILADPFNAGFPTFSSQMQSLLSN
jgi:RTX calcium-binding nonapeptide repeat (4 copies)